MPYDPKPIKTDGIELNDDLLALIERLAKNEHEVWARRRLADGWTYGEHRDDVAKQHPSLVPYEDLSESEKAYDRDAVLQAIKALLSLGYSLYGPPESMKQSQGASGRQADENEAQSSDIRFANLEALMPLLRACQPDLLARVPGICAAFGDRLLQLGEPLLAYDILSEGAQRAVRDRRNEHLLALALARSGATRQANELLQEIQADGGDDEETLGLLARTFKDLGIQEIDSVERVNQLRQSQGIYERAYRQFGSYWNGINAATLATLLDLREHARDIARDVHRVCLHALDLALREKQDPYWPLATLGEAALILGSKSEAEDWYGQAAEAGKGRYGDLSSTRRNARLLLDHLGSDHAWINRSLHLPSVIVFTGHMIDQPARAVPRFPSELECVVREAIRTQLKNLDVGFGYSSAACGSDILFLEALFDLGAEAHIVLPYDRQSFLQDSVDILPGSAWAERFERVLTKAVEVVSVSGQRLSEGSVSFEYSNRVLLGLAVNRAEQLETEFTPLAVWDGQPGDGPGGTASAIGWWRQLGYEVDTIDLRALLRDQLPNRSVALAEADEELSGIAASVAGSPSQIMALMFADAKGFSKLTEEQTPLFVRHFLEMVGELTRTFPHSPVMKNTWGDGLYFVFESVAAAGEFALELVDRMKSTRWEEKGLPDLSLRIGLHAGPVYRITDPVTEHPNCFGTHVSQAARIEPITPPNHVYASQAFAALASAERTKRFTCEYVGQTALAKDYGTRPTYVVHRRGGKNL